MCSNPGQICDAYIRFKRDVTYACTVLNSGQEPLPEVDGIENVVDGLFYVCFPHVISSHKSLCNCRKQVQLCARVSCCGQCCKLLMQMDLAACKVVSVRQIRYGAETAQNENTNRNLRHGVICSL